MVGEGERGEDHEVVEEGERGEERRGGQNGGGERKMTTLTRYCMASAICELNSLNVSFFSLMMTSSDLFFF